MPIFIFYYQPEKRSPKRAHAASAKASRCWGWAMPMSSFARSRNDFPNKSAIPYSVWCQYTIETAFIGEVKTCITEHTSDNVSNVCTCAHDTCSFLCNKIRPFWCNCSDCGYLNTWYNSWNSFIGLWRQSNDGLASRWHGGPLNEVLLSTHTAEHSCTDAVSDDLSCKIHFNGRVDGGHFGILSVSESQVSRSHFVKWPKK